MDRCKHCNDFGRLQIYRYGRGITVYCDCEAGDRFVEKIEKWANEPPKRLSDYPTLREYYLNRP